MFALRNGPSSYTFLPFIFYVSYLFLQKEKKELRKEQLTKNKERKTAQATTEDSKKKQPKSETVVVNPFAVYAGES